MRRLYVDCDVCGPVVLRGAQVTVRAHRYSRVEFRCPVCGVERRQICSQREAAELARAGARGVADASDHPGEEWADGVDEALIAEFRRLLAGEDWFDRLLST